MAHFVDDDANHAVLRSLRIGAVRFRTTAVETNHGVFHADVCRVHGNSARVGVVYGKLGVGGNGLGYYPRAVLLPQRIAFLGVEALRHDGLAPHPNAHGVPNELARGRKGKIPNVGGFELPRFFRFDTAFFRGLRFLLGYDEHRLVQCGACFGVAAALLRSQYVRLVLQFSRCCHHVITGNVDANAVVSEWKSKLAHAQKLLVLPAHIVSINCHAREELSQGIQGVVFLLEMLVTGPSAVLHAVVDGKMPRHLKLKHLSGFQRLRQIHPHHGIDHGVLEGLAVLGHLVDGESAGKIVKEIFQSFRGHFFRKGVAACDFLVDAVGVLLVLVQLQPDIFQHVWGIVGVGDGTRPFQHVGVFVQPNFQIVIRLLLVVRRARGAAGRTVAVWRWEFRSQLPEFGLVGAVKRDRLCGCGPSQAKGNERCDGFHYVHRAEKSVN